MVNQQMLEEYRARQRRYTQARYFTPGVHTTRHLTTEHGTPKPLDLLVVLHDDAPPAQVGQHRVDLIVKSGDLRTAARRSNGHLVNVVDPEGQFTDHTAAYTDAELGRIESAAGRAVTVPEHDGGPPGAVVYSVRGTVRPDAEGNLILDTGPHALLQPGSGADRYSLHDVQDGMDLARAREQDREQGRPASNGYTDRYRDTTGPAAARRTPGASSQAGLAAVSGGASISSAPAPGQPGSRFNPTVRERQAPRVREREPQRMDGRPVQDPSASGPITGAPAGVAPKAKRNMRMPTAQEISSAGRIGRGGAAGAVAGMKLTAAIPHPAGKVAGAVGGAVIGGARALVTEADKKVEADRKAQEKAAKKAEKSERKGREQTDGPKAAPAEKTPVTKTEQAKSASPASQRTPNVAGLLPASVRDPQSPRAEASGDRTGTEQARFTPKVEGSESPELGG